MVNGRHIAPPKSWATMIIGSMVDQGQLTTSETLNDIFDQDSDWEGVVGATEKKTITVEELLTMTSGLSEGNDSDGGGGGDGGSSYS